MSRRAAVALVFVTLVFEVPTPRLVAQGPLSQVIADQYIVVLEPGFTARAEAQRAEQVLGVRALYVYEHALSGFAFRGAPRAAQALAGTPGVRFVTQDRFIHAITQTLPTGIDRIDADLNATAKIDAVDDRVNVNIAILDTGIDIDHPDLNVIGGVSCWGSTYNDGNGHGTHVAGAAAALDNGTGVVGAAPGARLYAAKVLSDTGSGTWSSVICGIDWVTSTRTDADATNDVAVANVSLGGAGADDNNCGNSNSDALHQAICGSVARGVVYVVAAGNDNKDAAGFVPAAYDEVLTVSAVADSDGQPGGLGTATAYGADDSLASFSNWGADVDVAAPGVSILSTYKDGTYARSSGTSMAAPHATGAVALYVANHGLATDATSAATIRADVSDPTKGYSVAQGDPKGFTADRDAYPEPMISVGLGHDVVVTGISAPAWVVQGDSVSITVDTANPGNFAENYTVTLHDDTAVSVIGSQSVSLAAGATTSLTFTWATSDTTVTGDHVLRAVASTVNGETNTTNNAKSTVVAVRQPSHDVALSSVVAPAEVVQGGSAAIVVTAVNEGTYVESFTVTLRDATDGIDIGSAGVSSLAAGASVTLSFTWATSSSTSIGTHTLIATAPAVSGETATLDNTKSTTVVVNVDSAPAHIGDLDAVSTKLTKGQWKAIVTIAVHDAAHAGVEAAVVSGKFIQGSWSLAVSCTTDAGGVCSVDSGAFPSTEGGASFVVESVTRSGISYDPGANHDPDGTSDGTSIALVK